MEELITLTIDGKEIKAKKEESVLNVARANDIFIPAVCYLTRCSPTLACRLCLVEIDGKQVYSCNTKVKEGMAVKSTTSNIELEREAIMEVYDVNHPLQCGVCDQSGECELQNYSLYMKVNKQSYSIKDSLKVAQNWGVMKYDPALCIVCERCVTTCKDMIGSSALSTVKRDSEPLEKSLKEQMPKDAYAMWNKLNKSLIGYDKQACISCGECISACPVGALVSSSFQYNSNAWELEKIPASNPHSSDCTLMYYEVKHQSIDKHKQKKIYRVTNEVHYSALNGAARFAFDFENKVEKKDKKAFKKAVEAFEIARTIKFNSYITNEEAYILQKLAQNRGIRLVNEDARRYQKFLENYSKTSGKTLYSGSLLDIHNSDFIISVGSYLKTDLPNVKYALNNAVVVNKANAVYFHAIRDLSMEKIGKKGKNIEFVYHNPMIEESILYFILYKFAKELPEKISKKLKEEFLVYLNSFGQEESFIEKLDEMTVDKQKLSLLIGEDLIHHKNSENLARLCGLIDRYTAFKTLIIPTQTNSLGVAQICTLASDEAGYTVGYNQKADFQLSALGDGDIDIPSLNQQEGTFTNIDKKVVPTNAALPFYGYTLNEIANEVLKEEVEYTINYTSKLASKKGYKNIEFDDLPNEFLNNQEENRGYSLESFEVKSDDEVKDILFYENELKEDEYFIYKANPINQFNEFTALSKEFKNSLEDGIFFSKQLFETLELKQNGKIKLILNEVELILNTYLDDKIDGKISYVSTFMKDSKAQKLFLNSRYTKVKFLKV